MRALITGGAGFIGSHLAEALISRGYQVHVVDDLSTGRIDNIAPLVGRPEFGYTIDTVTNETLLEELVDRSDVIFHLAAAVGVKLVVDAPIHTIQTNVHGTETVLRHASRRRTPVLIVSTSEVYGKSAVLPFREDADLVLGPPEKHRWGYAASKLIDEFMAIAYWKERRLPVIIVRLFNTVGPRQSGRYGMVIPNFVRQALSGRAITVHGDGSQTRSFTSVSDVVWAMMALMDEPRAFGEIFNIGNGTETTIRDLARRVKAMTRSSSPISFVPYHEVFDGSFEDMPRRVPDISKIRRLIGFEPKVHLDRILSDVIKHSRPEMPVRAAARMLRTQPAVA
jgi:UDP-glucose 4-epimerase